MISQIDLPRDLSFHRQNAAYYPALYYGLLDVTFIYFW